MLTFIYLTFVVCAALLLVAGGIIAITMSGWYTKKCKETMKKSWADDYFKW